MNAPLTTEQKLKHRAAALGNRAAHKRYPHIDEDWSREKGHTWVAYAEGYEAGYVRGFLNALRNAK